MDRTNLVEVRSRVVATLLLQAGLYPADIKAWTSARKCSPVGGRRLNCVFFFERCETLELVLAGTSEKQLEFLKRYGEALHLYQRLRKQLDNRTFHPRRPDATR